MAAFNFPYMVDQRPSEVIKRTNMEKRFNIVKYDILVWESDESLIWDGDPVDANKFLNAVDEVQRTVECLNRFQWTKANWQENELLSRANDVLQIAMGRLEMELTQLLVKNCRTFEPSYTPSVTSEIGHVSDFSSSFFSEDDTFGNSHSESSFAEDSTISTKSQRMVSLGKDFSLERQDKKCDDYGSREPVVSSMSFNALHGIKHIAKLMFASKYDRECCQAYVSARKDVLDECLSNIQAEKQSIEEISRMNWVALCPKVSRWRWAMKDFIQTYLANEKNLCFKIFAELSETACKNCFVQSCQGSLVQLLNFGQGVTMGHPSPEGLIQILDMYEDLTDLIPEIKELFPEDSGSYVMIVCHELLEMQIRYAKGAISKLKNGIQNVPLSAVPFVGGGVHHVTKYVMNYVNLLAEYSGTLSSVLGGADNSEENTLCDVSSDPTTSVFKSIISALESRLNTESASYRDESLLHLFMMNNLNYMVDKVDDGVRHMLGEDWQKKRARLCRLHATCCERASWGPLLAFLSHEGVCASGSSSPSTRILKQRLRSFNNSFEEACKTQTSWLIPNRQLRQDMRISISTKVVQAYRSFMGLFGGLLDGERHRNKYVKYAPDDLESYLSNLFEGPTNSSNSNKLLQR